MEAFNLNSEEYRKLVDAARNYVVFQLTLKHPAPVEQALAQAAYDFALLGSTYGVLWLQLINEMGLDAGVTDSTQKRALQRIQQLVGKEQAHRVLVSQDGADRVELARNMGADETLSWSDLMSYAVHLRDGKRRNDTMRETNGQQNAIIGAQIKRIEDLNEEVTKLQLELVASRTLSLEGPMLAVRDALGCSPDGDVVLQANLIVNNNKLLKTAVARCEEAIAELKNRIRYAESSIAYTREAIGNANNELDLVESKLKGSTR